MRVLVGCERSGTVRRAFAQLGHDAYSADIEPADDGGPHLRGDVREMLDLGWDLAVFHPPCTYLANSGVHLFKKHPERWRQMEEAVEFFRTLLNAPIPKVAVENPVVHPYALSGIGVRPAQRIQPYEHGDTRSKATCLWLRGLPPLKKTHWVRDEAFSGDHWDREWIIRMGPGTDRQRARSVFPASIARAMAVQWSNPEEWT